MKKIIALVMLCVLLGFAAHGEDVYGEHLNALTLRFLNEDILPEARRELHDVDRNGEIVCLDYAVTFYRVWKRCFKGAHYRDIRLVVNRNPTIKIGNDIFCHIYMEIQYIDTDNDWEVKWYKLDSNVVRDGIIQTPAKAFGKLYDPAYDIYTEQEKWLKKAKY